MKPRELTRLAIFTAIALTLFVLEAQIPLPVPIPGVKLGLSNIITVCVLFLFGWKQALAVLLVRVLLGSVLTGQLGCLVYSLSGGLLSLLAAIAVRRSLTLRQLWVAGVIGAVFHNLGQTLAAVLVAQTPALFGYLPVLTLVGLLTGLFTGLCAQLVCVRLQKRDQKTEVHHEKSS